MSAKDIKNMADAASTESPPSLVAVDLTSFLAMKLPPRELILSPWLRKAGLCMIHAFRGIGKTHMSLGIAHAIAKGGSFLGWKAEKPRGVLFIDGEMPASALQERLAEIIIMSGDSVIPGSLKIITPDLQRDFIMPHITTPEGQQLIETHITNDIELVILDNISCLAGDIKENDAGDWTPIQSWILRLRAKGIAVLLIHHSGKGGAQRGTSKKEDVLDTVIGLTHPKDYVASDGARFVATFEKSRGFFGDDAKPFEAQLREENGKLQWIVKTLEASTYEKVIALYNDGIDQKDIVEELGINKSNVSRHIKTAREEKLITRKE